METALPRREIPEVIAVKRSDPVYMAHAYLTKVPVPAILPFIEAFTEPGALLVDPFAGSGMTGVAAAALGRRARLFDVSVLGSHIGRNYVNQVDSDKLRAEGHAVLHRARRRTGDVYTTVCHACGKRAEVVKCVWSMIMECASCDSEVNFYSALEAAGWHKNRMRCPTCSDMFSSRNGRVDEEPVLDSITCQCTRTQLEQPWQPPLTPLTVDGLWWPDVPIEEHRQMHQASALTKHGLTSTAKFFSQRNLVTLSALRAEIDAVSDSRLRDKLCFVFTAILTRASKRYQWSKKRPLNAANANYYVAPVFYEWNVFDLFQRKLEAIIRSDDWIREHSQASLFNQSENSDIEYEIASANRLPLTDESVDYIFMDPPFGSNIFYSDMNLFQEAWLGEFTDETAEAVVDRADTGLGRSPDRYERLLTEALEECRRLIRPGGYITMVFGNSRGAMWAVVQRAIATSGLTVVPEHLAVLDKGQRSVKGLASGFETVATLDLLLTLQPDESRPSPSTIPDDAAVSEVVRRVLATDNGATTPSHIYLELLRHGFAEGWDLSHLNMRRVVDLLAQSNATIDTKTAAITVAGA